MPNQKPKFCKNVPNLEKNKGISLLEIFLTLVISTVVVTASIYYFTSVNASNKVNTLVKQINILYKAGIDFLPSAKYQGQVFSGNQNIASTLIAGNYIKNDQSLRTPWSKSQLIQITLSSSESDNNNFDIMLNIIIPPIPEKVCQALQSRLPAIYTSRSLKSISNTDCQNASQHGLTLTFFAYE